MFGYVIANTQELSEETKTDYQKAYCGLCHTLGKEFGQLSRASLNYDMTFLILLLSSLYEPEKKESSSRCIMHPTKTHESLYNMYSNYAADMTVALTYYKCLDDWEDDRKLLRRGYAQLLKKKLKVVETRWPRQCQTMAEDLAAITAVEKQAGSADEAMNNFGHLMGELFVYQEDMWAPLLRQFGYSLGQFIYLMDATVDYAEDIKNNSYNPLIILKKKPEEMQEPLMILMGKAAEAFEKLPLVENLHLLRNVIYSGVWQQYNTQQAKAREEHTANGAGPL